MCGSNNVEHYCTKNSYEHYRCRECAFLFVHPVPNSTAELYDKDYFSGANKGCGYVNYDEDKEPMVPAFKKYLFLIRQKLGKAGALLDVGAATGFFVQLAIEDGFAAKGVEYSDYAASLGRAKGLDVRTGVLADVDGTYDCITMFDLIEHVPDPRSTLKDAFSRLHDGGILVINTPDAGSLLARVLRAKWHLIIPPEHIFLFDRHNIRKLLGETGFDVEIITTIGKKYTFKYVFKFLHSITGFGLFGRISDLFSHGFLAKLCIPINLHDNMFLIARKK